MDLKKFPNVTVMSHPLIKHKITMLRDVNTIVPEFRRLVKEIAVLEGYEALRGIPTFDQEVTTPIEKTVQPVIKPSSLCFVPILRAGMGMVDGLLELVPNARVGHLGLYRDEVTHKPVPYYCKLPQDIVQKDVYLLDPMLATGGSALGAIKILQDHGVKNITFLCVIAAPEGIEALASEYPDMKIYVGTVDRELNKNAYICPGLGDCGDRIFGTIVTEGKLRHE